MKSKYSALGGCLLGMAVGDALGLCFEGVSKHKQSSLFPSQEGYHFFFGKGMVSDDTEHACMTAQALIASGGETEKFIQKLSWRFRFWLLGFPGGIGIATLKAGLKLWLGYSGKTSGVFSAGNGPAMRSPLIGVCYGHHKEKMCALVRASTRMTHTDPKAEFGALAAALAAYLSSQKEKVLSQNYYETLVSLLNKDEAKEFLEHIRHAVISLEKNETTECFAESMGLISGITGYMYHTIPTVIHCWLRHQHNFEAGVKEIILCGGDTDTSAAILGAIIGSAIGLEGIPSHLLDGLWEWPRTQTWMINLGNQLAQVCESSQAQEPLTLPWYGIIVRNLFFFLIVLFHGVRRVFH